MCHFLHKGRQAGTNTVEAEGESISQTGMCVCDLRFSFGLLTIQQGPDERQQSWVLTDVLQPFNTDADIIQSHQHQPEAKHQQSALLILCTVEGQY